MAEHVVAPGMIVTLHLTMRAGDGPIATATEPDAPLAYLHGAGVLVPGLETRLEGAVAGDQRQITVPPAEAYGEADPRLLKAAHRSALPVAEPRVGMRLATRDADGELTPMTVVAIQGDHVLLDFNPRLAGATIHYDVEVVAVRPATEAEREAGRPLPNAD